MSVRLDPSVREVLEAEARARGVGLSTDLRKLATDVARAARHQRIRAESRAAAEHLAGDPAARSFYEDWGKAGGEVAQAVSRHAAGTVDLVDWRDALPEEANERRPAVVVEDADLFDGT